MLGQVSQFGPTLHNFRSSDPTIPLAQPLTDYTPAHGPLLVALGAHKRTRVTQSADGRTWPVEVAAIPSGAPQPDATAVELFDPQLRRGDLFMFHGFTFHAAAPNTGPAERGGLYIKVYAGL